jgi:hypothetical protein
MSRLGKGVQIARHLAREARMAAKKKADAEKEVEERDEELQDEDVQEDEESQDVDEGQDSGRNASVQVEDGRVYIELDDNEDAADWLQRVSGLFE